MSLDNDFDAMANACVSAAEQVQRHGSPELQLAMRMVLYILGCQIAGRKAEPGVAPPADAPPQTAEAE